MTSDVTVELERRGADHLRDQRVVHKYVARCKELSALGDQLCAAARAHMSGDGTPGSRFLELQAAIRLWEDHTRA